MTNEEAIRYFKRHLDLYCVDGISREAEEMAIQALSQEPCEDAISRADAIDQMEQSYNILDATDRIKALPSVTPSRRKGHWIEEEDFDGDTSYKCSECNEVFGLFDGTPTDYLYNYCPNCGAEMESEE